MPNINDINGLAVGSINDINGVLKANIADINGLTLPSAGVTPPLDTYTGAAAAYSVRLLRTAYTGNCMRVRRSSDNTEQDIGFDSNGDLDTAAIATFVGVGNIGYIHKLYDQSGNANDATSSATNQPEIYNGGVLQMNSKPTWTKRSDTGKIGMTLPSSTLTGNAHSIFASAYWENTDQKLVHASGYAYEIRGSYNFFYQGTVLQGNQNGINTFSEYIGSWVSGATDVGHLNGLQTASGSAGTNNIASSQVLFSQNYAARFVSKCQEIILYNSQFSDSNRDGLTDNLNDYYQVF